MDVTAEKQGKQVVDDEDDDAGYRGFTLHTSPFASVVFNVNLLSERVWVFRHVLTLVLRSQFTFQNIG